MIRRLTTARGKKVLKTSTYINTLSIQYICIFKNTKRKFEINYCQRGRGFFVVNHKSHLRSDLFIPSLFHLSAESLIRVSTRKAVIPVLLRTHFMEETRACKLKSMFGLNYDMNANLH